MRIHTNTGGDGIWLNGDPGTGYADAGGSVIGNPYLVTGRRLDGETRNLPAGRQGLYYDRARIYSPQLGRFMQTDPIGYADGMNMYAYCGNNPVNWIDPWGENVYNIDEWGLHSGIAVDIYDENGNVTGQRRFDFSAPPKWYFFLGIVAVKGFVCDQDYDVYNDPAEGVQITEYKSCQKEDEELLNKLEDQVKNPEIYGLFFNQCHQWTAKYLSKTGNPWNIGRDIVGGWKGPHPELKPKQNGQASQTNGHGASGTW